MFRSPFLAMPVFAALLLFSPIGQAAAQVQQRQAQPIELDQSLLDRWLVAMPGIVKLGTSRSAPQTDETARPHVERICAEARFDSYDQCAEVIGYVGMIVSACDRRTQTFGDPVVVMRRHLARLRANTTMPAAKREKAVAEVETILVEMPDRFPEAHIALMNANRARIFAALDAMDK